MGATVASTSQANQSTLVAADPWLAEICRRNVVRVAVNGAALLDAGRSGLRAALTGCQAEFAFAKLPASQTAEAVMLQDIGFRVVDVSVTLTMPASTPLLPPSSNDMDIQQIEPANAAIADRDTLAEIAGRCFRYSRFHLDPVFSNQVADEIKRQWVANYLKGRRGDCLWGARLDGEWAGFLAAIRTPQGDAAVIDLVGVDESFQGRGVGKTLIHAFHRHYDGKVKTLRVGTQAANAPSLKLYEKMGFRIENIALVLHWSSGDDGGD